MRRERLYRLAVYAEGKWRQSSFMYRGNRDGVARDWKRDGFEVRRWDIRRLPKVSA